MEYWKFLRKHLGNERIIMPSSLGAIFNDAEEILLVYHKDLKQWGLPGGLQNLEESIDETVRREIFEELNLQLGVEKLIGVYSSPQWHHAFSNGDRVQNLSFLFKMNNFHSSMELILQEDEIESFSFFNLKDLPSDCSPLTRQQCEDLANFDEQVYIR
jgi:ADP-ribose pyrophosphatase YjhB (NUDIX family)